MSRPAVFWGLAGRDTVALLLAATLGSLLPPVAQGELLDKIVAVVDRRPIFLSEIRAVQQTRHVGPAVAREALIDEILMYEEAHRYLAARPTLDEEASALASLGSSVTSSDPAVLSDLARRQATILKYIQLRFAPLIHVEEADIIEAYEERWKDQSDAPPLPAVRHDLLADLTRQRLDARIEEWVARLRDAASVRYTPLEEVP